VTAPFDAAACLASPASWTEANQRYLAAEFARLKAQLSGADAQVQSEGLRAARAALPAPAAIDQATELFALSAFERDLLLLCAGVEMDAELAACCAAGAPGRPYATFGLALAAMAEPHWSAITPVRPLRLWRLIDVSDNHGLAGSRLCIDERVLHYLAGVNYLDTRLRPLLREHALAATMAESHARVIEAAVQALHEHDDAMPVLQLLGDDGAGQRDVAREVARRLRLQLHLLRAADIPASPHELDALSALWLREAALLGSALLIECEDGANGVARLAERPGSLIFLAAREPVPMHRPALHFAVDKPGAAEQRRLWAQALGAEATHLNGALDGVATQFRLSADTIARTGEVIRPVLAVSQTPDAALWQACRASVRSKLDDLAQRVEPAAHWDDLVLPEAQTATLREIATHVKHRFAVYDRWGFAGKSTRGLGISALFAGESGTGKTMAAEVLANELHLDLYRIDLASTVSKYIGETEKNLKRIFDAAEDSGAILLFDEADALFGKRTEVNHSHDRYANIEVSYLLQRMEAYRGLAILTTNLKNALDTSFLRRLRFVVQFPFPDARQRELIWRGIFPAATPLDGVDFAKLARLNVTGGSIRNIAMNAAFLAAEANSPVAMPHLLKAARSEAAKRERSPADAETRGWV
jgi:ATPase family associated with various cellular activities (AAA)